MTYVLGRYVSEDEMEDYRREDREDKMRARLKEMGRRRGPDTPDACEAEGCVEGHVACTHDQGCCKPGECPGWECTNCLGTGVQR